MSTDCSAVLLYYTILFCIVPYCCVLLYTVLISHYLTLSAPYCTAPHCHHDTPHVIITALLVAGLQLPPRHHHHHHSHHRHHHQQQQPLQRHRATILHASPSIRSVCPLALAYVPGPHRLLLRRYTSLLHLIRHLFTVTVPPYISTIYLLHIPHSLTILLYLPTSFTHLLTCTPPLTQLLISTPPHIFSQALGLT